MPTEKGDVVTLPQPRKPAHRPSRRAQIVNAAIRVFARSGLADASVQEIADEAGVVPTAVYYHFGSKEELFDLALRRVLDDIDGVVESVRPFGEPSDPSGIVRVLNAVWEWAERNPEFAKLYSRHIPGATGGARRLHDEFERLHIQRAFEYLPQAGPTAAQPAVAKHASHALAVRSLFSACMMLLAFRDEGAVAAHPAAASREAMHAVAVRMVEF